jgi:hypothetical protein
MISPNKSEPTSRYSATPRRGPFRISSRQLGVVDQRTFGNEVLSEDGREAGRGFMELTGYAKAFDQR